MFHYSQKKTLLCSKQILSKPYYVSIMLMNMMWVYTSNTMCAGVWESVLFSESLSTNNLEYYDDYNNAVHCIMLILLCYILCQKLCWHHLTMPIYKPMYTYTAHAWKYFCDIYIYPWLLGNITNKPYLDRYVSLGMYTLARWLLYLSLPLEEGIGSLAYTYNASSLLQMVLFPF